MFVLFYILYPRKIFCLSVWKVLYWIWTSRLTILFSFSTLEHCFVLLPDWNNLSSYLYFFVCTCLFSQLSLRFFSLLLVLLINLIMMCLFKAVLIFLWFVHRASFFFSGEFSDYFFKYSCIFFLSIQTFISVMLKSCGNSLIFFEICFWALLGGNKKPF